ncbi:MULTISPECIES: hypothetical protein [unclassified Novosphingobium]|uniref:hypothetical protein n=1 Tax=unclassified Novosphingobium TaxID=2644732 RepID=UPI00146CF20A|nr:MULTISPECIES: hypothetical protein [unclassified Novosphingobium]NMN03807.1 hypothetical protein [Novosphingobium sp. SG919]NMN86203.1 hypothetical protein [Novosphingobium sp. SG916]
MSGPKVVRIVTREELIDICHGHLARVDAALDRWIRVGQRNDCLDDAAIAQTRSRRDKLAALIAADRFMDLQKQAPQEEQFLRDDLDHRLAAAAAAQADATSKARRSAEASAAVLSALRNSGNPIDPELEQGLARGDPDATSRALLALAPKAREGVDRQLASRLKTDEGSSSFAGWLASAHEEERDPAVTRISVRIAQIRQIAPGAVREVWEDRLAQARSALRERRHLILDALEIETGRSLTAAREREEALTALTAIIAQARVAGLDVEAGFEAVEALSTEAARSKTAAVESALLDHRNAAAVAASRDALLSALGELGYELTEGMATAWATDGRLVLRSGARPDYGVEVSGSERVQMKPVAFERGGIGPDAARDRDAETIWCGDVSRLQSALAAEGGGLHIERALPVGAVPLKRIALAPDGDEARASMPSLKSKSLR